MADLETLLAEIVRREVRAVVREVLDEHEPPQPAPLLVNRAECARLLSTSPSTLDRLRERGMPHVMVADTPKFDPVECVRWLRQAEPSTPKLRVVPKGGAT